MRYVLIFITALLSSFAAWGNTVTAAQDPWPPFVMKGEVNHQGISVDIVTAALASQGYQVKYKAMAWSRALNEVKEGRIDILPATWFTQDRTNYLTYSDSYLENSLKFIKKAGDSFEFDGMSSLGGKKIGIVRGYGYGDEFLSADNFSRPEASNLVANLKKLLAGRIHLTLEDELVAKSLITSKGLNIDDFSFTNNALSINRLHVTSGKANARSAELITAFNKGLITIKGNGKFNEILNRYGIKQ
ncbi:transporter substrate-binding domain-containing protein [Psychromonas sp. Urea-02u-13]|uniref:transporter substrate-binding domain-containing protein n=1 Tax=Psychromonas sp. Urea-02u-13 TaxID=2058326 RepID=UPI000C32263E|nr:transporter substrate-binding domain-containing protein [Psychromonas sp. Urea-02u-13]PKG37051.1 amino acid ABC transporter substrate-binding protein [Psychromonas sp. Urea-02u-13]